MKTLFIDIETRPHLVYTWNLANAFISSEMIIEPASVICFAAKWHDGHDVQFWSVHHDGREAMLQAAHDLLNQADVVVHYNGKRFDIPHLNREFVQAGIRPPTPYKQVDLLAAVRKRFKFGSNKLKHVAPELAAGDKIETGGFDLWADCLNDDAKAWAKMREYNCEDVRVTESLYLKILPWIPGHPNVALFLDKDCCPACGSEERDVTGHSFSGTRKYPLYTCQACGKHYRSINCDGGSAAVTEATL